MKNLVPYVAMTICVLLLAFLLFVFISVATGGNSLVTVDGS